MDFIAYEPSAVGYWVIGLLVLGFLLFLGSIFVDGPNPVTLIGALLIAASFAVGILAPSGTEDWSKDARAEIKDNYGVTLSEKQFEKLKYPKQKEEPEGDFEQYGSVTVVKPDGDRGFEKTEVYLLWSDGEMILASPDEQKKLQPLKTRD